MKPDQENFNRPPSPTSQQELDKIISSLMVEDENKKVQS